MNPRRSVVWLGIAFFAIVAALLAVAGVSYTVNALGAGSNDYSGVAAPQGLVIAAVCFFCFALLVYTLIQLEHKLRRPGWDDDFLAPGPAAAAAGAAAAAEPSGLGTAGLRQAWQVSGAPPL